MNWNFPDKLENSSLFKLIDALLTCDCLKNPDDRNQILDELGPSISSRIKRSSGLKMDISAIVKTCLQFQGGMNRLYDSIKSYEGEDSTPWINLQKVTAEILGVSPGASQGAPSSGRSLQLSKEQFDQVVELLIPLMEEEEARRPLVQAALHESSVVTHIQWGGSAATFTQRLARQLYEFGEIVPGEPALVALLKEVKNRVGLERKAKIDKLLAGLGYA